MQREMSGEFPFPSLTAVQSFKFERRARAPTSWKQTSMKLCGWHDRRRELARETSKRSCTASYERLLITALFPLLLFFFFLLNCTITRSFPTPACTRGVHSSTHAFIPHSRLVLPRFPRRVSANRSASGDTYLLDVEINSVPLLPN